MHVCHQSGHVRQIGPDIWQTLRLIDVQTQFGVVRIYPGYVWDRETGVINSPDYIPALVHDFLYQHRIYEDGTPCTRAKADLAFFELNRASHYGFNRAVARIRYMGVRWVGYWVWRRRRHGDPIPTHARIYYLHFSRQVGE